MQSDTNNNHSSPFSLRRLVALITAVGMCTCECKFAVTSGRTTVDRKSPFVNHNPENCFHYSAVYFGEVDQGDERNQERIHPGISFLPFFRSLSLRSASGNSSVLRMLGHLLPLQKQNYLQLIGIHPF